MPNQRWRWRTQALFLKKKGARANMSSASVPGNPGRDDKRDRGLPAQVMTVTVTKDV
jgi:hypothetical protein